MVALICSSFSLAAARNSRDLPRRVGIAGGRGLELAQAGLDAQARPLVRLEIGRLAAQQVGALADLAVLQGDHGLAHQRQGLVAADHQALLA